MQLKTVIKKVEALSYMINNLDLQSGLGRKILLESYFMTDKEVIDRELNDVEKVRELLSVPRLNLFFDAVKRKLSQVKDVRNTVIRLSNNAVLEDIELFELKHLCILCYEIVRLIDEENIDLVQFPDILLVLDILDPEKLRLPNFFIYDAYSEELARLRKELKKERQLLGTISQNDVETYKTQEEKTDIIYQRSLNEEDKIRIRLSDQLSPHWKELLMALEMAARLDNLIAKAAQATQMALTKPSIHENITSYKGIFHPQLKTILESEQKRYQPIDVALEKNPCLITGANMAGKTVLLKCLQLSQYLFQFGFFVPAQKAEIMLVEDILTSMDDEQEELRGLSSFAAEILSIDRMIKTIRSGKNVLILIDELARTTNPVEGSAIVNGMLDFLGENKVQSIITTHYSGITAKSRKLRVKGFIETKVNEPLTKENIGDFIDYSLEENREAVAPMEALRVAKILNVDKAFMEKIDGYLKK
jgi:DNA mismatch repair ATPase MutS